MNPAVLVPLVVAVVAFVGWCWYDLSQQAAIRHLPRWAWAIVCLVSVPLGGIAYLLLGRGGAPLLSDDDLR